MASKEEELERQIKEYEDEKANGSSPEQKKKKKKAAWKYVLNISLVLIATVVALVITLHKNFWTIMDNLAKANIYWILGIIGILLLVIVVRGLVLTSFARLYTRKYHLHQGIAVDQIGTFYNAVTPGGSGGEFMQAYTFKKQGIPISSAVSMMAMYSIVFQSVLIVYGLVSFFVKFEKIISMDNFVIFGLSLPMWLLAIIGFFLNVSVILIILLLFSEERVQRIWVYSSGSSVSLRP